MIPDRRAFLRAFLTGAALAPLGLNGRLLLAQEAQAELAFGAARPFDFEGLVARARDLAAGPYEPPRRPHPEVVQRIDYDEHGAIQYRRDEALYGGRDSGYPVTFFHLGKFFPSPVRMFALEGGEAREVLYAPGLFEMPADSPAQALPPDTGFAGFRLHESLARDDWRSQDWVAFLGASYFRAIGALNQYGLSARGIAIDTATAGREEFPNFTEFYLEPAAAEGEPVRLYALLEGPSLAGAYRFDIRRGEGVVMDIACQLFLRKAVKRFGVAPLTSMYWYGEPDRPSFVDWRPEIHDSDGLALWTGAGERAWRPLRNPKQASVSSFQDRDPRGFGLLQRDRDFEHYLDGVNYDRRPSLWVEPLGAWGEGAVQLVELPTDDEIHDNIGAFWVPKEPVKAGDSFDFSYRLHWLADEPYPPQVARCTATRIGRGGEPGTKRPQDLRRFVVEFAGASLEALPERFAEDEGPEARVTVSRGGIERARAERVPGTSRWRAVFDVREAGTEPVEIRLYLALGEEPLSETWLYRHDPLATRPF